MKGNGVIYSIPQRKGGKYKRRRGSRAVEPGMCGMLVVTGSRDARGRSCGLVNEQWEFVPGVS